MDARARIPPVAPPRRRELFEGRDVTQLVLRAGLGLVIGVVGWFQASDQLLLNDQAPWLALAVAGLVLACASGALWILQLRRAVSVRAAELRAVAAVLIEADGSCRGPASAGAETLVVTTTPGAQFFHRDGCAFVDGRATGAATEAEHRACRRLPCEVCIPSHDRRHRSSQAAGAAADDEAVLVDG